MNKNTLKYAFWIATFFAMFNLKAQVTNDSIPPLPYPFTANQNASLYLSDFENYEVIYDAPNNRYIVISRIGDYEVRFPIVLTQEEYAKYRLQKEMHDYYKRKVNALNSKKNNAEQQKDLLPKYYIKSDLFETLFGGNEIEVNVQGSIEVKMGLLYQKVDNPQLNETNRSSTIFDFDQNIGASISAKVGERLKVTANYDTQSTFDFQNIVKLEFDPSLGYDDDGIIKKLELGNVSMPVKNSLISGTQDLFGFKTELQFGRTSITTAIAKQQSQTKSVSAQGGSVVEEFELKASDYDADRHFFLAQYFKDNFDTALQNYPLINSSVQITKIEVWATNSNRSTENVRNIVALADLAESRTVNIGNTDISVTSPLLNYIPDNDVNELTNVFSNTDVRNISSAANAFSGIATMSQGRDYSILENARRLVEGIDFTVDRQLGFISLNKKLADSEVLAVAYEYTINGSSEVYKVGELSSDGVPNNSSGTAGNLVVKLLRSELVITDIPMWNLMMKNIYNLQAYQLQEDGFRFELLYANDATGVPTNSLLNAQTTGVSEKTLLNLLYLDRLDSSGNTLDGGDGYFDYIDGITVFPEKGYIMFPKVQPFGSYLSSVLTNSNDSGFIFNELYQYTQTEVQNNYQQKDKYEIKGYYKSDSSQGISLGAFNIPQGSVKVTSGGLELVEGVDYVVDYQMGKVKIINPSLEASNAAIQVSLEQNSVFSQQRRTFFGFDMEHKFSDNFIAGATFLNLTEQPYTSKVSYGQEPINNSVFGFNAAYHNKSDFLTKLANKISFGESQAESNFSIRGDVAYLIPGTPKRIEINGEAASYIDDFEGTQIPIDVRSQQLWYLASTPQNQDVVDSNSTVDPNLVNLGGNAVNTLDYGKKRARLAWYNIDNDMYGGANKPNGIDNDELSRAEVRRVSVSELFPNDELDLTESTILRTLDLAFYPSERGENNFDTENINPDGTFSDPENRWGGITRPMTVTDFENSNIEYIQFWMMDPYKNYSITNAEGLPQSVDPTNPANQVGELYFNLGNISEDILKDNRKMYENGLPEDGGTDSTDPTIWGKVPSNQSLLYAFDDSDAHRLKQDIGFDGLDDTEEQAQFASYISSLPAAAQAQALEDPSSDNYMYYKSTEYDNENASILTRYKKFNRSQGNSPTANMSPESYSTSATQYPDAEDINKDQTMSTVESYYQYKISLNKQDLDNWRTENSYIVDQRDTIISLPNGRTESTTWYQFRVPVAEGTAIGGINNFHSIRFMRMFLTRFKMPVVLRFGQMEMVRGEWRRYKYELADGTQPLDELNNFESGVVNIEENDGRQPIPYVLPPGIERERLQGTTTVQLQNEQSLALKVRDLPNDEGRSLYKNVNFDMRMFKKLQMFIHAESKVGELAVNDDELVAIIRIGSDLSDNYYQIEKPLKITQFNTSSAYEIWPEDNELNVDLDALKKLKLQRSEEGASLTDLYPLPVDGEAVEYRVRVKGNPNLGKIKTIMLGVKNMAGTDRSAELWFNELRVSDFDNKGGWAAIISADANLSDVMDISMAGRMSTIGYGNVDQSVNERSQEDTKQYDIAASINAGKFLPQELGLQIPVNVSVSEEVKDPKYDPQYQDILMSDTNSTNSPLRNEAQDYTKRTSFSVINLKKNRNPKSEKKQHFYDIENVSASYAFNQMYHRDYNVQRYLDQNVKASVNYNYSFKSKEWEPFKNSKSLDGKYLKLIKDFNFNPIPNSVTINTNIYRSYSEQQNRELIDIEGADLPILKKRNFQLGLDYTIGFKPTKSIRLDFRVTNSHVYDDFDYYDDVTLFSDFLNTGRPTQYHQNIDASYQIPINKIPLFSFVKSTYAYTADFDWTGTSREYLDRTGNTIGNANTHNLTVDLDLKKFYKDIGSESLLRTKAERSKDQKAKELAKKKAEASGDKKYVKPKLSSPSILSSNKKNIKGGQKVVAGLYNLVTAVKSVKVNYSENNNTTLPGYSPEIGFLGRDNYSGGFAPTLGFVFGSQIDIRNKALENGWLLARDIDSAYYSKIFSNYHYDKLDVQAKVTPFKDFDIDVRANKIYTRSLSEQMDVVNDDTFGTYLAESAMTESGNFSMSYLMIGTSFKDPDDLFNQFKQNRIYIAQRYSAKTGLPISGYGNTSQQIILPAFLAAYSGQSVQDVNLGAFRNIPLPNWQVNYRGLMKLNWFKNNFSNFSITHSYKSAYTILNFSNNSQYNASSPDLTDSSGNYYNEQLYTNVSLAEEFSPLVKIEMKLKNSLTLSGRLNMDRTMTLNFNNNTMTQDIGKEYVLGFGYRFKDVPFSMRLQGRKMTFKGDVNLKLDVSLRDDLLMVRYFGEDDSVENNQTTGGQKLFNINFSADYNLNKNLQAGLYYIQDASRYAISTTYPRQSISAGLSFKYNLGN